MKMVTSYNTTDMVVFGQFCADLVKNGMLFPDEKISKAHFENWKVGVDSKYSICPKALRTAQMLTYQKVGFNRDPLSNFIRLGRVKSVLEQAHSEGVVVVYPLIESNGGLRTDDSGRPKIGTFPDCSDSLLRFVSVREERSDFPYVHASVPFAQFPIYEFDRVVAFGACFHISDVLPDEKGHNPQNKAVVNSPECA